MIARSGGDTYLERTELASGPYPQGFCYSTFGLVFTLEKEGIATEHRNPSSYLALAPAPLLPVPTPTKVMAASIPWGERYNLYSLHIQLSQQSHRAQIDCIGMLTQKDTPSRLAQETVSTLFSQRQKGRKWEDWGICLKQIKKENPLKKQLVKQR